MTQVVSPPSPPPEELWEARGVWSGEDPEPHPLVAPGKHGERRFHARGEVPGPALLMAGCPEGVPDPGRPWGLRGGVTELTLAVNKHTWGQRALFVHSSVGAGLGEPWGRVSEAACPCQALVTHLLAPPPGAAFLGLHSIWLTRRLRAPRPQTPLLTAFCPRGIFPKQL